VNRQFISFMIFVPLLGALLQSLLPSSSPRFQKIGRWTALFTSLVASLLAVGFLFFLNSSSNPDAAIGVSYPWVGSYAITYDVAIDGMNALLVLLVAIVFPVLIAAEWKQKVAPSGMHGLLLVLQTAFFGALCSQDIFLMFFFWAMSALPFYFLIGIWGGEGRESAASHAMIATAIGNALLFSALILIYYSADPHTFLLHDLTGGKLGAKTLALAGFEFPVAPVAFGLVSLGLAFRAPIWPFHGWFTHVAKEAPASVFVALCAVSVPIAIYIFVKLCYSLFPETVLSASKLIDTIGILNLIICGICAVAQRDLKLLVAFLCLSEVGLLLLGVGSLNSAGVVGVSFEQLVMGLGLAGFGLFAGIVHERVGHTMFLDESGGKILGGVSYQAPTAALFAGVLIASLLGFPGLGGFVGESLLVIGSYSIHPAVVLLVGGALLLAVYYLFNMYNAIFLGSQTTPAGAEKPAFFADLSFRERSFLFPLAGALLICGIYPKPFIEMVRPAILTLLSVVK
jgi:NADH-quinone oxidoreductase subunit M